MAAKQALAKVSHQLFHLVREKLKFKYLQTTVFKLFGIIELNCINFVCILLFWCSCLCEESSHEPSKG